MFYEYNNSDFNWNHSESNSNGSNVGFWEEELPSKAAKGPSALRMSLYAICVAGIILNVIVFWKRKSERYV